MQDKEVRIQHCFYLTKMLKNYIKIIVHFDTGAEGDYLAHVTFIARAKRVRKVT